MIQKEYSVKNVGRSDTILENNSDKLCKFFCIRFFLRPLIKKVGSVVSFIYLTSVRKKRGNKGFLVV